MKTKNLKRQPETPIGGSLKPVGSEILGEILIREYTLSHLEHELRQCIRRVEQHREWLRKLTAQLGPNDKVSDSRDNL